MISTSPIAALKRGNPKHIVSALLKFSNMKCRLYQSMVSPELTARSATKMSLIKVGYADNEIKNVDLLQRNLSDSTKLQNRCAVADAYFSQTLN